MAAAQLAARFEEAMTAFELKVRPQQKVEFECRAKCAGNMNLSAEAYQECQLKCGERLDRVQRAFAAQVKQFEEQYVRCGQSCEDIIRNKLRALPQSHQGELPADLKAELQQCAERCSQTQLDALPAMVKQWENLLR
eukprot:m.117127 g.117127  ORF g.117127 m.117127 type:complete len:137 (+) comp16393_c0_seq4:1995-2405(+)